MKVIKHINDSSILTSFSEIMESEKQKKGIEDFHTN